MSIDQTAADKIPGIDDDLPDLPVPDELTSLKEKADLMGLQYHPSIGLDKLRAKVAEAIAAEGAPRRGDDEVAVAPVVVTAPAPTVPVQAFQAPTLAPATFEPSREIYVNPRQHADTDSVALPGENINQTRLRLKRHANELIRIRVTCMNPAKKEWEGEIIGAGNNLVGTVTKYIPFGNDEGWHVARILYNVIRDRVCQIFVTTTDKKSGQKVRTSKMIKEFGIEVLDPLTEADIAELKARQAATRSID